MAGGRGRGRGRGGGGIRAGNVKRRFGGREPQHHQHRHLQHATSSQTPAATTTTTTSHHRPRRGPPAIFVTCEAGREHKCKRETFELLHHYYYASRGANNDDEKGTVSSTSFSATTTAPPSTTPFLSSSLTLEEELSMLRKGAVADEVLSHQPNSKRPRFEGDDYGGDCGASMKSPFAIYDTGMRGMICILCTLPQCEYIPYDEILMQLRIAKENKKKEDNHCSSGNDGDMQRAAVTTTTTTTTTLAAIAAVEDDEEGPSSSLPRGDQEEARGDQKTNNPSPILWDPVQTVKCILGDAKRKRKSDDDEEGQKSNYDSPPNSNIECAMTSDDQTISSPPGSRFISRILPMQATCYASVEEIKAVSLSLLRRCLPDIIQSKSRDCAGAVGGDNDVNTGDGGRNSTTNNITFKLEIKKRLCTHLTRDGIIEAVTPSILGGGAGLGSPGCTFSVNLTDPDFSLRIETCKALCGISILPREDWYGNFNLAEINDPDNSGK